MLSQFNSSQVDITEHSLILWKGAVSTISGDLKNKIPRAAEHLPQLCSTTAP